MRLQAAFCVLNPRCIVGSGTHLCVALVALLFSTAQSASPSRSLSNQSPEDLLTVSASRAMQSSVQKPQHCFASDHADGVGSCRDG